MSNLHDRISASSIARRYRAWRDRPAARPGFAFGLAATAGAPLALASYTIAPNDSIETVSLLAGASLAAAADPQPSVTRTLFCCVGLGAAPVLMTNNSVGSAALGAGIIALQLVTLRRSAPENYDVKRLFTGAALGVCLSGAGVNLWHAHQSALERAYRGPGIMNPMPVPPPVRPGTPA